MNIEVGININTIRGEDLFCQNYNYIIFWTINIENERHRMNEDHAKVQYMM